jgi:hypothetical protein
MPLIDGWYNVISPDQSMAGQLRVRIAPDIQLGKEQETGPPLLVSGDLSESVSVFGVKRPRQSLSESRISDGESKYSPPPAVTSPRPISPPKLSSRIRQNARVQSSVLISSENPKKGAFDSKYEAAEAIDMDAASSSVEILHGVIAGLDRVQERLRNHVSRDGMNMEALRKVTAMTLQSAESKRGPTLVPFSAPPMERDLNSSNYGSSSITPGTRVRAHSSNTMSDAYSEDFEVRSSRAVSNAFGEDFEIRSSRAASEYTEDFEVKSSRAASEYSEDFEQLDQQPSSRRGSKTETEYTDDFENLDGDDLLDEAEDDEKNDSDASSRVSIKYGAEIDGGSGDKDGIPEATDPYILHLIKVARMKRGVGQANDPIKSLVEASSSACAGRQPTMSPDPENIRGLPGVPPVIGDSGAGVGSMRAVKAVTVWEDGRAVVVPLSKLAQIENDSADAHHAMGAAEKQEEENEEGAAIEEGPNTDDSDLRVSVVAARDAEDKSTNEVDEGSSSGASVDADASVMDSRETAWMRGRNMGRRTSSSSLIDSMRDSLPNLWVGDLNDSGTSSPALSGADSPVLSGQDSPSRNAGRHTTPELDRIARIMRGSKAEEDSSSDDEFFEGEDVEEIVML